MRLDSTIQELCIAILCYDQNPKAAAQVSLLVPPREYDSYYRDIAESADAFRTRFGTTPGEHTLDLIRTLKERRPDSADFFDQIFDSLENIKSGINREFVLTRAAAFARRQRTKRGITKAVELYQLDTDEAMDEADAVLLETIKHRNEAFDPGTFLHDSGRSLKFLDGDESEAFPCGIKELDAVGLGPRRKQMWMLIAGYNKGKTFAVVHVGKWALINRKRVLHISLEMSEEQVCERYFAGMFSMTRREQKVKVPRFQTNELGQMIRFDNEEVADRPYFKQDGIRRLLQRKALGLTNKSPLLIKQFPTGFLTIAHLNNYLDSVQAASKFVPDLLIIDYPDLMDIDSKNLRHSTGKIYQQLRGIAVERNLALVVPSQVNTEGATASTTRGHTVSEDRSKMHIADTVVAYSQTDSEYEFGMGRLSVEKARGDQKHQKVLLSQAYAMGQFCIDSALMRSDYTKTIEAEIAKNKQNEETDDSENGD